MGRLPPMSPSIDPTEIDDRDLGREDPSDPAALQRQDATLCPGDRRAGVLRDLSRVRGKRQGARSYRRLLIFSTALWRGCCKHFGRSDGVRNLALI